MLTKHKIWLGAGVVAAAVGGVAGRAVDFVRPFTSSAADHHTDGLEGGEAGENRAITAGAESGERGEGGDVTSGGATAVENGEHGSAMPVGGSFDDVLKQVLVGEGGQGGLGISPLRKNGDTWSFTVPALDGTQVRRAVAGNSLRSENHFAVYFTASGEYRGWALSWSQAPLPQCPSTKDPNRVILDGECWIGTENPLHGTWSVKGDTLCLSPSPGPVTEGKTCVRAALILNSLVLFGPDGRMLRKGSDLRKGEDLPRKRSG